MDAVTRRRAVKAFGPKARRILTKRDPLELGRLRSNEYEPVIEEAATLLADGVMDLDRRLSAFIVVRFKVAVGRDVLTPLASEMRAVWDELVARA